MCKGITFYLVVHDTCEVFRPDKEFFTMKRHLLPQLCQYDNIVVAAGNDDIGVLFLYNSNKCFRIIIQPGSRRHKIGFIAAKVIC